MADTKKKKASVLSPQERAEQRERRLENDRKAAEQVSRRTAMLRGIPDLNILTGSFSLIPVHLAFYAREDVMLFSRGMSSLTRVRKGDLVQLCCSGEPRGDRPCVVVHNGKCVFAVKRGEQCEEFFNLSSHRREDDIIHVDNSNFIGSVVFILEAADTSGLSGNNNGKNDMRTTSSANEATEISRPGFSNPDIKAGITENQIMKN